MSANLPPELVGWSGDTKYEVRGTLGQGAMGVVLDAFDRVIERRVAIKIVRKPPPDDAEGQESVARFKREAQAAGRLSHPHIVGVYDYGEDARIAWIVMELVTGGSLKTILDRDERIPLKDVARLTGEVLEALAYAHARGIVHRDIKPANVMLSEEGRAKLADFGIARIENSAMTQAGTLMGTPSYMAPEQFRGEPVDARADIWATGVMLYQLLTGEKPFSGGLSAVMHKVLNTEPVPPSSLSSQTPRSMDAVVMRALSKRPDERWPDAKSFAAAIAAAMELPIAAGPAPAPAPVDLDDATMVSGPPPIVPRGDAPPPAPPRPTSPGPSRPGWLLPVAGLGGVAVAGVVAAFLFWPATQPAAPIAAPPPPLIAQPALSPGDRPATDPAPPRIAEAPRADPAPGPLASLQASAATPAAPAATPEPVPTPLAPSVVIAPAPVAAPTPAETSRPTPAQQAAATPAASPTTPAPIAPAPTASVVPSPQPAPRPTAQTPPQAVSPAPTQPATPSSGVAVPPQPTTSQPATSQAATPPVPQPPVASPVPPPIAPTPSPGSQPSAPPQVASPTPRPAAPVPSPVLQPAPPALTPAPSLTPAPTLSLSPAPQQPIPQQPAVQPTIPPVASAAPQQAPTAPPVTAQPAPPPTTPSVAVPAPRPVPPAPVATPVPTAAPTPATDPPKSPAPTQQLAAAALRPDFRAALAAASAAAPCGLLAARADDSGLDIQGVLPRAEASRLRGVLADRNLPPGAARLDLGSFEGPYCTLFPALRAALAEPGVAPRVTVDGGSPLRGGQFLRLSVAMPEWATHLHAAFVGADGTILVLERAGVHPRGARVRLGDPRPGFPGWEISEPFGTDLIVVIASEGPIFPVDLPEEQASAAYAAAVTAAVEGARRSNRRVALRPVVIETAP